MPNTPIPKTAIPHSEVGIKLLSTADGFEPNGTGTIQIVELAPGAVGEYTWATNDLLFFKSSSLGAVVTMSFGPFPSITQYGGIVGNDTITIPVVDRCRALRVDSQFANASGKVIISIDPSATDTVEIGVLTY